MPDCDVAVVGAGVIGTAITYELVARGASVTLLDCRGAGLGSTQAAAGMLVPYLEGFGRPLLPLATKSLEMYDAFVDRVSRDAGVGIGYRRTGSLQVVTADQPLDELRAHRRRRACGRSRRASCSTQHGGAGGRTAADARGVRRAVHEVTRVCRHRRSVRSAGRRRHQARRAGHECPRARSASSIETVTSASSLDNDTPVTARSRCGGRRKLVGTHRYRRNSAAAREADPRAAAATRVGRHRRSIASCGDRDAISCRRASGSILVGATVEDAGFDERTTVAGVRDLLDSACDLVPHLWQATFVGARVGLRPATCRRDADHRPLDENAGARVRDRTLSERRAARTSYRARRRRSRSRQP